MIPRHAPIQAELVASEQPVPYKQKQIVPEWVAHGRDVPPLALPIHAPGAQVVPVTLILMTAFTTLQELPSTLQFTIARHQKPVLV
jgi:hypothetical protein